MFRKSDAHALTVLALMLAVPACSAGGSSQLGGLGSGTAGAGGARVSSAGGAAGTGVQLGAGGAMQPGGGGDSSDCKPNLTGIVRDFDTTQPDFENVTFGNNVWALNLQPDVGLVQDQLVNGAPVLANTSPNGVQMITSADTFSEWYSLAHPADRTYEFNLDSGLLQKSIDANGNTVYESTAFFPIDGVPSAEAGFMDGAGNEHNFHFTFELNTKFVYKGGEVFTFSGDDDLWIFIDGKLVVDVGGVHPPATAQVVLDDLGLTLNATYPLSIFHAERHTVQSNFKITTSIEFTNCEPILR